MPNSLSVACCVFLAAAASAQVTPGQFGFTVTSTSSNTTAGTFCRGFQCTPFRLAVTGNDTLQLTVRTELNQPFVIAVSPAAGPCVNVPGVVNQFGLASPWGVLFVGAVTQPSPILACWSGFETVPLRLPNLPSGLGFVLQAVAAGPGPSSSIQPAFTSPVACSVQ